VSQQGLHATYIDTGPLTGYSRDNRIAGCGRDWSKCGCYLLSPKERWARGLLHALAVAPLVFGKQGQGKAH